MQYSDMVPVQKVMENNVRIFIERKRQMENNHFCEDAKVAAFKTNQEVRSNG